MATDITYNGVRIYNCVTREFDQELMYDQSGTDLVAIRYKIGVEGHVHSQRAASELHGIQAPGIAAQALPQPGDFPTALMTAQQFDRVSQLLTQPRGYFVMTWDGETALRADPGVVSPTAHNDVNNGPKPRGLSVVSVTPSSVRVSWSVEFMLSGCPGNFETPFTRKPPFKIINNRWSITEGRDADFFTSRRISGTIRFAEGLTAKHAFIGAVMPGLERGFKRESIEYTASEDGLEATYQISDRQVHYSAPWPATKMDVSHTYSTNDATTWLDNIQVTLRGSPEASRRALLQRMMQIVDSRGDYLAKIADNANRQYQIVDVAISESFGEENVVSCNLTFKVTPDGITVALGNILENQLGKPLELPDLDGNAYDPTISRAPALHGYDPQGDERNPAFLFLLTCYWQDPCGQVKNIFGGNQTAPEEDDNEEKTVNPYPQAVSSLQYDQGNVSNYSTQHAEAMYTMSRMSSRYIGRKLRVQLPLGQANQSGETCEFATLGAGLGKRIIYYEAERLGAWPQIPEMPDIYSSGDLAGKLLDYQVETLPPVLSADGYKKIFALQVKYIYGLTKLPAGNLAVGSLPYTNLQPEDKVVNFESQQLGTIGPGA